ncbi:hypothetical protein [Stenotrophomonas sp. GZD-301]|uniref:hypothetical protein n=1 Tax=Stenotrophomonas sp. GZD-301 TaxID=3404814 RepID=UPI003BB5D43B
MTLKPTTLQKLLYVPRLICIGAALYALLKVSNSYTLLRSCMTIAIESGDMQICQRYPESIDGYVYLMIGGLVAALFISHYMDMDRSRARDHATE